MVTGPKPIDASDDGGDEENTGDTDEPAEDNEPDWGKGGNPDKGKPGKPDKEKK